MTESISGGKIQIKLTGTLVNTLPDGSASSVSHPNCSISHTLASGVGYKQADRAWQRVSGSLASHDDQVILDLRSMTSIDIGGGAGNDGLGQAVAYENIMALVVVNENAAGAAGQLEVFPSVDDGWSPVGSHTVANGGALKAQGVLLKLQLEEGGFDVPAAATRLTLRANGGAVTYSVYVWARSADYESSSSASSVSSSSVSSSSSSSSVSTSSSSVSTSSVSTSSSSQSSVSTSSSKSSASSVSSSSSSSSSESSSSRSSSSSISTSSSSP